MANLPSENKNELTTVVVTTADGAAALQPTATSNTDSFDSNSANNGSVASTVPKKKMRSAENEDNVSFYFYTNRTYILILIES